MKQVNIKLETPDLWCKQLHESLPSTLSENVLTIDKELGAGGVQYFQILKGLWVNQINLTLHEPLGLLGPKANNDYFMINFHFSRSTIDHVRNGERYKLGIENINILLSSSTTVA